MSIEILLLLLLLLTYQLYIAYKGDVTLCSTYLVYIDYNTLDN
jgi:hypothetical protein